MNDYDQLFQLLTKQMQPCKEISSELIYCEFASAGLPTCIGCPLEGLPIICMFNKRNFKERYLTGPILLAYMWETGLPLYTNFPIFIY